MLKSYPKFERYQIEEIFKELSKEEQNLITEYLSYRKSCGLNNISDLRRTLLHTRHIIECEFKDFKDLNQHSSLIVLIKNSKLRNSVQKNMKIDLNNFFGEFLFPEWWSAKFKRIYSNKNADKGDNYTEEIAIPTDKEVEKMIDNENSTYWKTFLLVHAMTGFRTKETRLIELKNITFNSDESATIKVHMTKTGKDKVTFTDKQTTFWIKKLIKENEEELIKKTEGKENQNKYLFPSRNNSNIPISRGMVNYWFKALSIKSTGKHYIPYSLRHKKATQLYELANNNKIAESTALKLMGHSKSQMKKYDHTPKDVEIKILKEQAFNIELSPDKRHELVIALEKEIEAREKLEVDFTNIEKSNKINTNTIGKLIKVLKDNNLIENIEDFEDLNIPFKPKKFGVVDI